LLIKKTPIAFFMLSSILYEYTNDQRGTNQSQTSLSKLSFITSTSFIRKGACLTIAKLTDIPAANCFSDVTEEQLTGIFSEVGPVQEFV
jgi:hypothetical protein